MMSVRFLSVLVFAVLLSCFSCEDRAKTNFTFVQMCDTQLGMGGYEHDVKAFEQSVDQINQINPEFVVICGDLVHHATDSSFDDFERIISKLSVPYLLAPGNHDINNIPTDSTLSVYRTRFGEDYFQSHFGDVTMIIINTQLIKEEVEAESSRQLNWLIHTLDSLSKTNQKLIVAGHYPLYVVDAEEEEQYFNLPKTKRRMVLKLFKDHDVLAYLSGHKHELVVNEYEGIQLVSGETTSKNFDKRPLGFRKWQIANDTISHEFVPLDQILLPNTKN